MNQGPLQRGKAQGYREFVLHVQLQARGNLAT